jgi:hypothetical protein
LHITDLVFAWPLPYPFHFGTTIRTCDFSMFFSTVHYDTLKKKMSQTNLLFHQFFHIFSEYFDL